VKKRPASRIVLFVLIGLLVLVTLNGVMKRSDDRAQLSLATYQSKLDDGLIKTAEITETQDGGSVKGRLTDGTDYEVDYPASYGEALTQRLIDDERIDTKAEPQKDNVWLGVLFNFLPIILIVGLMIFLINQMQGGGSRVMQFGKARTKQVTKDSPKVTFADVDGVDEAIEDLQEIMDFLENPQ
jgi:cell division protease FtsH